MNRVSARELALRLVFEMGYDSVPIDEFLGHHLSSDYFSRNSDEDELYKSPPDDTQEKYIRRVLSGISEHWPEIDGYIERHAIGWRIERMSRITASILRLCIFEILYMSDVPDAAAINAAVDLAKKYESVESSSFINGVLGSFWRLETGEKA